jgi:hypothetical protein
MNSTKKIEQQKINSFFLKFHKTNKQGTKNVLVKEPHAS